MKTKQRILVITATVTLAVGLTSGAALAANAAQVTSFKTTGTCPGCDLSGADLKVVNLMTIANAQKSLVGANLSSARFDTANLYGADCTGANASYANMSGANLSSVKFNNANLSYANLSGASVTSITKFTNANLTGVTPPANGWRTADLTGARWIDGVKICGPNSLGVCK